MGHTHARAHAHTHTHTHGPQGIELFTPPGKQERIMLDNKNEPYWRLTCRACVAPLEEDAEMVIRFKPDLSNVMAIKDPGAWRT